MGAMVAEEAQDPAMQQAQVGIDCRQLRTAKSGQFSNCGPLHTGDYASGWAGPQLHGPGGSYCPRRAESVCTPHAPPHSSW